MTTRYEPDTLTGQVQKTIHEEFKEEIEVEPADHDGCVVSVGPQHLKSISLIEDVADVLESRGWTTSEWFENIYGDKKILVEEKDE